MPQHLWITGGLRADRERVVAGLRLPSPLLPVVDAHRRLSGPYTVAGCVARGLVPGVLDRDPGLMRRYDVELLSAAPDLAPLVSNSRETLTSLAIPDERTRFYALLRTTWIANGLVEFVVGALPEQACGDGPAVLVVENVHQADRTDLEFLAAAIRRIDPRRLTLVICSPSQETLAEMLGDRVAIVAADEQSRPALPASAVGPDLAWEFVRADCVSDRPDAIAAYEALDSGARALLHDRRAAELAARAQADAGELSPLGALPYHLEHGGDPAGAGVRALRAAQDYCISMGFYEAAGDYGQRGLALADPAAQPELWWGFVTTQGLALSVTGGTHAALALYDQARQASVDPNVHMAAAYSTAMLYTRHNDPAELDQGKAKAWLNSAIATASLISDPGDRAFQGAFYRNGLALVEVHLGSPEAALRLVDECIASLDRELRPDEHRLHRSVLKNNRARVYAALGRLDEALEDYAVVIGADPNHPEHYLERGNILRRQGRNAEAAADYATALRLSPPFPEIYYNRGDLRLSMGDREGAIADFSYALELDPSLTDAYVNRAGIYLEDGEIEWARQDAVAGLRHDPDNAYLHAVLGGVHMAEGEPLAATAAYDKALAADPSLATAWAGRAEAQSQAGDEDGALASLNQALEVAEDAALLFNRATVFSSAGRWADAAADLTRARELDPDDPDITELQRACEERLGACPAPGQPAPARAGHGAWSGSRAGR